MEDDKRWRLLYSKKLEMEAIDAFRFLRRSGIEPILIKGLAAARNYPADIPRYYDDVDLAVGAADFGDALHLLGSESAGKLGVDLHCECRQLDTKPWAALFNDSIEICLHGETVRIPSDEDHFRILAVHWLNDGGIPKDRLWDIYYAVENRRETFDWDKCFGWVGSVRRGWIIAAIGLANRYLELDISGLPFAAEAKELPEWLIQTIESEWKNGIRLRSLHTCLREPRELFRQIRKRIPPNAVEATIEMEGHFDNSWRLPYQVGSMMKRLGPSVRGIRTIVGKR